MVAVVAVALLWWRYEAVGAVPVRCVSLLRQASPPLRLCHVRALLQEEESELGEGEAFSQCEDCACLVGVAVQHFVQCFEERCNNAALR